MKSHFSKRRQVLLAASLAASVVAPTTGRGQQELTSDITTTGAFTIKLQSVASINAATAGEPLDLAQPVNDGANGTRLFVATHGGQIRLVKNGSLQSTPFVTINNSLPGVGAIQGGSGTDERGLIGLAFHPNFNNSGSPGFGKFYTFTSESINNTASLIFSNPELGPVGTGTVNYQNVLREWTTNPASDTLTNTTSRELFRINKQQTNHNGGGIRFGPNNLLYLAVGDGGGGNDFNNGKDNALDGHTNVTGNAQDTNVVYGKILRIDPLATGTPNTGSISANGQYGRPSSNPFSGGGGLPEIFLDGVRNPFRFSFDRNNSNALYIGDVGQTAREEVDRVEVNLVTSAIGTSNLGWPYLEGTLDNSNYAQTGAGTVVPIAEYTHGDGISISAGFLYRGTLIPQLVGKYIFGDYSKTGSGTSPGSLFYTEANGGDIHEFIIDPTGVALTSRLYSLGEDQSGELYGMLLNGNVVKLIPEPASITLLVGAIGTWSLKRPRRARA